jgi:SAM-dependent methyltransferase
VVDNDGLPPEGGPTQDLGYTQRLETLEGARWKQLLDVQRPYRWNLRRSVTGRTLEVGCGIGRNLLALTDAVGVDHNAGSIEVARSRGLRAWSTAEWPTCPDAVPASFDTLLVAHVLEHMDAATADDLMRSYLPFLRERARLVLICPQERGYASDATHVRFVDAVDLVALAQTFGFSPVRTGSFPLPRVAGRVFTYNEFVAVADR